MTKKKKNQTEKGINYKVIMNNIDDIKVARICWNADRWRRPSGKIGKSDNEKAFEEEYGFGHEEWIFDFDNDKNINDYHYSFLQAYSSYDMNNKSPNGIFLYFIKDRNYKGHYNKKSTYHCIAYIKKIEYVDENECNEIVDEYKKRGLIDKMKKDINNVNGDVSRFESDIDINKNNESGRIFNIKFNEKDVVFIDEEIEKTNNHYYNLCSLKTNPIVFKDKSLKTEDFIDKL